SSAILWAMRRWTWGPWAMLPSLGGLRLDDLRLRRRRPLAPGLRRREPPVLGQLVHGGLVARLGLLQGVQEGMAPFVGEHEGDGLVAEPPDALPGHARAVARVEVVRQGEVLVAVRRGALLRRRR